MTRAEFETAVEALGWVLIDGPRETSAGWRGTIQLKDDSLLMTTFAPSEQGVFRDLLRRAQEYAQRWA